jgi:Gas vesicle synthesis protein GvpL/GvpF
MAEQYVYGVMRAAGAAVPAAEGVDGRPVRKIGHGGLAALVSEAPAGDVKANRRNLLAHTRVLQQVVESECVLPMQFGVVMPSERAVADDLLAAHEADLLERLEMFAGLVEVELKVTCPEEALLRDVMSARPDLVRLRERLQGKPADATYFERVRLGELVAAAIEERREAVREHVVARLEPAAVDTAVSEPAHEQMLVNVAFLVEHARLGAFDDQVDAVARGLGDELHCKYVGPLPPFHFVDAGAGSAAWA